MKQNEMASNVLELMKQKLLILAAIVGMGATITAFGDDVQVVQTTGEQPTVETFVHNLDSGRYQLVKKKHNKEFYVDKQTGERWRVEIHRAGHGQVAN
jgi:hypothetical protein